jgi:endonuclease/exonuclease/phosphatase family metal-dependent hydrolase
MKYTFCLIFLVLFANTTGFSRTKEKENTVRILTFNILHGATTKGDFDLDKLASIIKETNPDLVALQEVDYKTKRARNYDLVTEMGWRTKMSPLFGKAMNFDGGAYGVGFLSKQAIIASRNFPLPSTKGNEPRTSLEVFIQLESGDTIRFVATHLDYKKESPDRISQVQKINSEFVKSDYPTILAGDLNATPESKSISILKEFWQDSFGDKPEPTYSSKDPQKKIDYIMYRPENRWEVIENKVICDAIATDHCVVLSVLKLLK